MKKLQTEMFFNVTTEKNECSEDLDCGMAYTKKKTSEDYLHLNWYK